MDLRHLHTLVVLAEELHYGRAARRLHVAQPAVTRTIQDLGLGKLYAWLSSELDMRFGTQFIEDLPMVVTQAYPGESFSDIYVKADAGCANYDKMRKRLLREARARAEEYPPIVRRRLGAGPL